MNSKTPRVSIILPNYNHEPFLRERLDTIIAQTFADWELIILDDCSGDRSMDVIREYAAREPRITHVIANETNSGSTFRQWRKGIALASAPLIWIAESDDAAHPEFLEEDVGALDSSAGTGIVFCNSLLVDGKSEKLPLDLDCDDTAGKGTTFHDAKDFIRKKMLVNNRLYNASAVVFHRGLYEKVTTDLTRFRLCGDWVCWAQMIAASGQVAWIHRKLNSFRQHTDKVTSQAKKNGMEMLERAEAAAIIIGLAQPSWWKRNCMTGYNAVHASRGAGYDRQTQLQVLARWRDRFGFMLMPRLVFMLHAAMKRITGRRNDPYS